MTSALAGNMEDDLFTWEDYCSWPDGERWELLHGEAYAMSPSPSYEHQDVSAALMSSMRNYFKGKPCRVLAAPMDVKLSETNVVQPDLLVVCDPAQIKGHIEGPPALVVEILSPASIRHDRLRKTELYARFGVKEYWIVTPFPCLVEIYRLHEGRYLLWQTCGPEDQLTSPAFPGMTLQLADIFAHVIELHAAEEAAHPPTKPPPSQQNGYPATQP